MSFAQPFKAMDVIGELKKFAPGQETALTVGVFDGVHLGHQHLLNKLVEQASQEKLLPGVVTFDRHPEEVISPGKGLLCLTNLEQRKALIRGSGISLIVVLPFTLELSQFTAHEFISLLRKYLGLRLLVVGPDFALGRNREGNPEALKMLGQELDFKVLQVPPFELEGVIVRSTLIRELLSRGELGKVAKFLGRKFILKGEVLPGADRGRVLGFPTANILPNSLQVVPPDGVYATQVRLGGKVFPSVTNIGVRPTFGGGERWVEVHILGFQGNLYGQRLTIEFLERLRDEVHFASPEQLKTQIEKDIKNAESIAGKEGSNVGMA